MAILPVNSTNSDTANNTAINNAIRQLNNEQTTKIIKDDTGTRRVLIGSGANGFEGIKVSKPTIDVYTAANADLVFNSEQDVFKIVNKLSTSFSISSGAGGSVGSFSLTHSLGYKPFALGSFSITSSSFGSTGIFPLPYSIPNITLVGGINTVGLSASISLGAVTSTDFSFSYALMQNSSIAGTVTMYILQETAV